MVGVAQSVRAPGCGPGGRGFNSHLSPHFSPQTFRLRTFGFSCLRLAIVSELHQL